MMASPSETDRRFNDAPSAFAPLVQSVQTLEDITLNTAGIEGVVLRYGYFYGDSTNYALDGTFAEDVLARKVPMVGAGDGVFSFIHVEDAAAATVLAVEKGSGIYNIVDDEPAAVHEWLPVYIDLLGAPKPMQLPQLVGRVAAGRFAVYYMNMQRGASNAKAKRELGWRLNYPDWREGFQHMLTGVPELA